MKGFGDLYKSEKKANKNTQFFIEQLISDAIKLQKQGNIREAIKYYQKLISHGCNNPIVFSKL